jgi:hypothetical protein
MRNPFLLHFLNLSDDIGLSQTTIKYGWCERNSGGVDIQYANEQLVWEGQEAEADLVDIAINLAAEKLQGPPVRIEPSDPKSALLKSALVRVRDADIGVQAFFSFIEGVLRNAAKHRPVKTKEDKLELRIVLCRDWKEARALLDGEIQIPEDPKYCYAIISADQDVLKVNGKLRTVKNENNKDVPLLKFLQGEIKKPIIEASGEVASGTWGLKELKICAAFVSGANLDEVNSEDPNYVWVCKCPEGVWQDGKPRLAWVVRLEKPRYVLAVVNEKPRELSKWEDKGVEFVLPQELATTNRDYDFLYVDSGVQLQSRETATGLPQRQVVDSLAWANVDDPMRFVYAVYDKYLESIVGPSQNGYTIIIYFGDEQKSREWTSWLEEHNALLPSFLTVRVPGTPQEAREIRDEESDMSKKICIFRHIRVGENEGLKRCCKTNRLIYQQFASYSDAFFSFLHSIQPDQIAPLLLRQVLESAALNVLIIDERIAQIAIARQVPDASEPIRLDEALYWMGVYVASSIKLMVNDNEEILQLVSEEEASNSRLVTIDMDKLISDNLDLESPDGKRIEDRKIEEAFKPDILLIHATKLKEIAQKLGKNAEELISDLKTQHKRVIVHSGRGRTKADVPRNAPFLEYSIVQRYVTQEPSKFYLVQIALNAREDAE